jgi:hypothetical protein
MKEVTLVINLTPKFFNNFTKYKTAIISRIEKNTLFHPVIEKIKSCPITPKLISEALFVINPYIIKKTLITFACHKIAYLAIGELCDEISLKSPLTSYTSNNEIIFILKP